MIESNLLKNKKNIFMIGICGISMSGIACILKNLGYNVTGSNNTSNPVIHILIENNISVHIGHDENNIDASIDAVIYTAAIPKTNPEMLKAAKLNIPMYERSTILGEITSSFEKSICICGTHGKTTTTSMVSCAFLEDKKDPTVQVGAQLKELNNLNYIVGNSEYMVVESCEYVDSFLEFYPQTVTITNIEWEHVDYFKDIEQTRSSFKKFISKLPINGVLVSNLDDENCRIILSEIEDEILTKKLNSFTYSLENNQSNCYLENLVHNDKGFYSFDAIYNINEKEGTIHVELSVPGIHNVYDALACISTCLAHDIGVESIVKSLKTFTGASRRFEFRKIIGKNVYVFDDYAHHPTELKTTVEAAACMKHNKLWIVFQPHTYSRTKQFMDDFLNCFDKADEVILTDIYSAREQDNLGVSSKDIEIGLLKRGIHAKNISDFNDIAKYIKDNIQENDLVLTIGAGTVTDIPDML